jgi:hypothetical protein
VWLCSVWGARRSCLWTVTCLGTVMYDWCILWLRSCTCQICNCTSPHISLVKTGIRLVPTKSVCCLCNSPVHQHTSLICGSTNINSQGEYLVECLVSIDLNILKASNEPIFVMSNRKEVIALTLGTAKVGDWLTSWHVSDEICVSDHRYSGTSTYRFSRGWRKQTMNVGKWLIRETVTHCK